MRDAHIWTIVLAAGEGSRLRDVAVDERGRSVPKQFWKIDDDHTMLEWTLRRAGRLSGPSRTIPIVAAGHRRYWERDLSAFAGNLVVQPENRGTAAGILLPLLEVLARDREATVAILPSDHYIANEAVLAASLRRAVVEARSDAEPVVLLGITPDDADPELGYIVPDRRGGTAVAGFVEKPALPEARELLRRGAVWNSFILVARAVSLVRLFARRQPELLRAFLDGLPARGWSARALETLYASLPSRCFSRDVLQKSVDALRVIVVPPCGWSDLGTPRRVGEWRAARTAVRPRPDVSPMPVAAHAHA